MAGPPLNAADETAAKKRRDDSDRDQWGGTGVIIMAMAIVIGILRGALDIPDLVGQFITGAMIGGVLTYRQHFRSRMSRPVALIVNALVFGLMIVASSLITSQFFPE